MINWLEELLKAAEEGREFNLPESGETDLLSAINRGLSRAEENQNASEGESLAQVPEMEGSLWQNHRSTLGQPEADGLGATARSVLRAGNTLTDDFAVKRLYRSAADSALAALYHRVRETVSPVQPAVPGHGNTVVVREEAAAVPGLTEEKLDRSLRRDSRRYDGGMSIY